MTKRKDSIPLSPQHGVNPCCLRCPMCGADAGVALLGWLPKDAKAPREARDKTPCDKCLSELEGYKAQGFVLIVLANGAEARKAERGYSPWLFYVGILVIKKEAAERLFRIDLSHGMCYLERSVAEALGLLDVDGNARLP